MIKINILINKWKQEDLFSKEIKINFRMSRRLDWQWTPSYSNLSFSKKSKYLALIESENQQMFEYLDIVKRRDAAMRMTEADSKLEGI